MFRWIILGALLLESPLAEANNNRNKNAPAVFEHAEVTGPIVAGDHSSYLLYIPKSLRPDKKAPLLFYTNATGGSAALLEVLRDGAEINGWIMAISIESRNDNPKDNLVTCETAVDHILKTQPVDKKRLYFTGNSGGGAQAYENADAMRACGAMPNIGYIPSNVGRPKYDCFIINGGYDYNRYCGAIAREEIGDRAVHRLNSGGHGRAPDWLMIDGMVWLEGRYLADKGRSRSEEAEAYLAMMLKWIEALKQTAPHRAYYWARFLQDELNEGSSVQATLTELETDKNNRLYVEGLEAIDRLSQEYLARFGETKSYHKFQDQELTDACQKLLQTYQGVPEIEETLRAMCKETE